MADDDDWGDDADFGDDADGDFDDGGDEWGDGDGDEWVDGDVGDAVDDPDKPLSWDIKVENLFYEAESDRKSDKQGALAKFLECIKIEEENAADEVKYRFNALKYVVQLQYELKKIQDMVNNYKKLLGYAEQVTPNELNNAIRSILNEVEGSGDAKSLVQMYSLVLSYFKQTGKQRFWFEFAMKLCKTYFESKDLKNAEKILDELHASCKDKDGHDDMSKGAQLLEIYAVRIQIVMASDNRVALNELFERTKNLFADINDPRSMSVIKECWGKMYASMNNWNKAYQNFFDAFRAYSSIGHKNVKQCLKYVVIATMLSSDNTNPFATQEAGVYKTNKDIEPIASLLEAFDEDDINKFEITLKRFGDRYVMNDDFIIEYMPDVKLKIRSKVLVKLIKPYKRVKLEWLCKQLNATIDEMENLVVNLILDGSIKGKINQIQSLLDLSDATKEDELIGAIDSWINSISRLQNTITNRTSGMGEFGGRRGYAGAFTGNFGLMDLEYDNDIMGFNDDVLSLGFI